MILCIFHLSEYSQSRAHVSWQLPTCVHAFLPKQHDWMAALLSQGSITKYHPLNQAAEARETDLLPFGESGHLRSGRQQSWLPGRPLLLACRQLLPAVHPCGLSSAHVCKTDTNPVWWEPHCCLLIWTTSQKCSLQSQPHRGLGLQHEKTGKTQFSPQQMSNIICRNTILKHET